MCWLLVVERKGRVVRERVMNGMGGWGDKVNFNHEQVWKIVALLNIILWSTLPIEITVII